MCNMLRILCYAGFDIIFWEHILQVNKLEKRCHLFEQENLALKQELISLQGEVYGARLASKYLDKELAGR